jgi:DNA repair exonuclease SbcCD ATPase subunit
MLITEWPTLRRWLDDSSALRAFHHELRAAAKQWQTRGNPGDLVWRGAIARDALRHVATGVLELSALEQQFVAAIRRRRLRARLALAAAAAIVTAGVAFAFFKITRAEGEARANLDRAEAAARQLADQIDQLKAEQHARATAEQQKTAAEQQKTAVEQDLAHTQQMSREQLEDANAKLVKQVAEAEAAKQKAQAEEQKARKASEDAQDARAVTQKLLDEKQRELDLLKKRKQDIIDVDLTGGSK